MTSEITRPSLLVRVRDPADEAAWRDFEQRYRDLILRYCRASGLQQADAEDVRQAVFLNLAQALRGFRYDSARGRFRGYLHRVVRNAVHRHFRRAAAPAGPLDSRVPDEGVGEERDERWEREWMFHHYRLALATVRATFEPQSVSVFERLVQGASVVEVARETGLSEAAVHKIKQRVRDRLRELIEQQLLEEDPS
jgi:RNA polymerase sigma-70 factor (ECF subfamily)